MTRHDHGDYRTLVLYVLDDGKGTLWAIYKCTHAVSDSAAAAVFVP